MVISKLKDNLITFILVGIISISGTMAQENTVVLSTATGDGIINKVNLDGVVLNKEELEKIGIVFKNKAINIVTEEFYKISRKTSDDFAQSLNQKGYKAKTGIYRKNISVTPANILPDEEPMPYDGWSHAKGTFQFPVAVTIEYISAKDKSKSALSTMYLAVNSPALKELTQETSFKWEKDKFVPKVSKLLPVTYIVESNDESNTSVKFHFWFYTTKELIEKLPENYKKSLFEELGYVDKINNGEISPDSACDKITSNDVYLDICESSAGALNGLVVYPNPVVTNAKCRLILKDSRSVSAILYDGGGAKISDILENSSLGQGNNEFDIPFDELPSGIYILIITTNKNERISTKIIVAK